jgi:hypothetical protein
MAAILAKRGIVRVPTNPLAYPCGIKPGVNPNHVAAGTKILYSGVASGSGFVSLLNGSIGAPSTNNQPTAGSAGGLGPALRFPQIGADSAYGVTGDTSDILTFTMAGIAQISATTGLSLTLFHNAQTTSGNIGIVLQVTSGGFFNLANLGSAGVVSTITPALNAPYLLAASNSASGNVCNMIAVNLLTGKTDTYSSAGITTDNPPSGAGFTIGNRSTPTTGANTWSGLVAAIAFTNKYMSLPLMRTWAADPWSFWYPRS